MRRCVERRGDARPCLVGLRWPTAVRPNLRNACHYRRLGDPVASPSITTSASRIETATEHRGSRATLRPLRVVAPVWNQNAPSTQTAPTAVTCGLPSALMVTTRSYACSLHPVPAPNPHRARHNGGPIHRREPVRVSQIDGLHLPNVTAYCPPAGPSCEERQAPCWCWVGEPAGVHVSLATHRRGSGGLTRGSTPDAAKWGTLRPSFGQPIRHRGGVRGARPQGRWRRPALPGSRVKSGFMTGQPTGSLAWSPGSEPTTIARVWPGQAGQPRSCAALTGGTRLFLTGPRWPSREAETSHR